MFDLKDKQVLVIGLGASGLAACELLHRRGASVFGVDSANTEALRGEAGRLKPLGIEVKLGVSTAPDRKFNLAVVSRMMSGNSGMALEIARRNVPVIGEMELGYQQ